MVTFSDYNDFFCELVKFKENMGKKLPEGFWNHRIRVCLNKECYFVIYDRAKMLYLTLRKRMGLSAEYFDAMRNCRLYIAAGELLSALEETFSLGFDYLEDDCRLGPMDKYFSVLLKGLGPAVSFEEVSRNRKASRIYKEVLIRYNQKLLDDFRKERQWVEIQTARRMKNFCKKSVYTKDGLCLDYYVYGNGNKPALILANAYGIGREIWRYVINYFSRDYRIITWETRGTSPADKNVSLKGINHAEDLQHILAGESIERADFICWCSGLKILMEYYRLHRDVFNSISVITGYFNPMEKNLPLKTEFDFTIGGLSKLLVNDPAAVKNPSMGQLIEKLFQFNYSEKTLNSLNEKSLYKSLNTMIGSAKPEIKAVITKPFSDGQTLLNYAYLTVDLQGHDISRVWKELDVPVLMINAGYDIVSNPESSRLASEKLKNCEYVFLDHATHWCLWEDYEKVNPILESFLIRQNGSGAQVLKKGGGRFGEDSTIRRVYGKY